MSNKYYDAITRHPLERTITDKILCRQYENLDEYIVVYIRIKIKFESVFYKEWYIPMSDGVLNTLEAFAAFKDTSAQDFIMAMNYLDFASMIKAYHSKLTVETSYIDYEPIIMTQERLLEIQAYVGDALYNPYEEDDYFTLIKRETIQLSDYWLMRDAQMQASDPFAGLPNPLKNAQYNRL